ncbi:Hsp70 family protein [Sphingomonas adhaesiva]|uniref:Hsp70 family protein n=1 Tax=Sphingomonas adhaesiva TaxID=28212 RepID=UPI002FF8A277
MIVGIDLGTTNSAVAIWREGAAHLIPNSLGDLLTPSAVSMTDDGDVLIGAAARDRQATHHKMTATVFKRLMGTPKPIHLGTTRFTAEDLSALILRNLKRDAEQYCGEEVTGAVITVPAYFNDRQRKATRRAGELAGLNVERLVNEPTAAALAYGIADRSDREPFLVFDLGGGTFDVSIVEIFDGIVEVRASAGDNRLGGEDFNDALALLAQQRLGLPAPGSMGPLRELMRAAAERTRRALTHADAASFSVVWDDREYRTDIAADEFEAAAARLVEKLREPVLRAMRDSRLRIDEISEIVLVGGATRMPVVRKAVTRMFSRFPNSGIDPDRAIALGAAVQAGLKAKSVDLAEIRLTDVCPFTLGVDVMEQDRAGNVRHGVFAPIIERNTILPTSRSHRFQTAHHHQNTVAFGIYQGESRLVSANVQLGSVTIPVPTRPAGQVVVDCRFSYDVSGLLEVDVTIPATGATHQLVICDDEEVGTTDLEERRAALALLKVHPRDQDANVALLSRAERCYEAFIGDARDDIGQLIAQFESTLSTQDERLIADMRREANDELDRLEGERFL